MNVSIASVYGVVLPVTNLYHASTPLLMGRPVPRFGACRSQLHRVANRCQRVANAQTNQ